MSNPIPRNLKSGPYDLEPFKNYTASFTKTVVFLEDPNITALNTLVEDAGALRGDIWPLLTPVWRDDPNGGWRVWTDGQSIEGFLIGKTGLTTGSFHDNRTGRLRLDATDCVMGLVMLTGEVHYRDIYLPPGESQADLDQALAGSGLREDGIMVLDLPEFH